MTLMVVGDWVVAIGACVCALLQLATFRISRRSGDHPLLTGGRALLLAGWLIAAMRLLFVMIEVGDLPLPPVSQLWIFSLELGTVFVTLHWIHHRGDEEWRANR
jgi:hypothetical protein